MERGLLCKLLYLCKSKAMKHTISLFCFLLISIAGAAQGWQWAKGETCGNGLVDGYLSKTDKWNNVYTGGINQGDSVCFDQFKFYNPHGNFQAILQKYDSSGNIAWAFATNNGQAWPIQITTDKNGYLYLLGAFFTDSISIGNHLLINPHPDSLQLNSMTNSCYFIAKFDTAGNVVWAKTGDRIFLTSITLSPGGIGIDNDLNIYICGSFHDSAIQIGTYTLVNANDSTQDIFVAKYDSLGNVIWAKGFGGNDADWAMSLATTPEGDVYFTGTFYSPFIVFDTVILTYAAAAFANYPDFYVGRIDRHGNIIWARSSVGSAIPYSIAIDNETGIYTVGAIYDTVSIAFGSHLLNGPEIEKSAFITKYDAAGTAVWAKALSPLAASASSQRNTMWGLTTDPCNNVWASGYMTRDSTRLDSVTVVHAPVSGYPTLIVSYTENGTLLQYLTIPIVEDDLSSLSSDKHGNIYLGDDASMVTLDNHTVGWAGGSEKLFIAKYDPGLNCNIPEHVEWTSTLLGISIYPNPANNAIIIECNSNATASIYDVMGRLVGTYPLTGATTVIPVQNLEAGVYQCIIRDAHHNALAQKLVILH